MAQQVGAFIDPNFSLSNVCLRADTFKEAVMKAKPYACIIFDEAYGGLASRRAMSNTNHMLVDMMCEIRQKNLAIILVLPSFFDLDKYAAIHRTRCLIHVKSYNFERGFFDFYTYKQKKLLYLLGKKTYDYKKVRASFRGRFPPFYPIDKIAYKKLKLESMRSFAKDANKKIDPQAPVHKRDLLIVELLNTFESEVRGGLRKKLERKLGLGPRFITELKTRVKKFWESKFAIENGNIEPEVLENQKKRTAETPLNRPLALSQ